MSGYLSRLITHQQPSSAALAPRSPTRFADAPDNSIWEPIEAETTVINPATARQPLSPATNTTIAHAAPAVTTVEKSASVQPQQSPIIQHNTLISSQDPPIEPAIEQSIVMHTVEEPTILVQETVSRLESPPAQTHTVVRHESTTETVVDRLETRRIETVVTTPIEPQVTNPVAVERVREVAAPQPTVQVHIGRIIIRASQPSAGKSPRPPATPPRAPQLSLNQYLNNRKGGSDRNGGSV